MCASFIKRRDVKCGRTLQNDRLQLSNLGDCMTLMGDTDLRITECGSHPRVIGWWHTRLQCQGGYGRFLSVENMKWYSSSQVLTAKHVPYPQLTATQKITYDHWKLFQMESSLCNKNMREMIILLEQSLSSSWIAVEFFLSCNTFVRTLKSAWQVNHEKWLGFGRKSG